MNDIDQQLQRLSQLCAKAMRRKIRDCLHNAGRPMTTREIAEAMEVSHISIQRAVCEMYGVRHELEAMPGRGGKPRYYPIDQGVCEWCGTFDGHLVAGQCPQCSKRAVDYDPIGVIRQAEQARAAEQQEVAHVDDYA